MIYVYLLEYPWHDMYEDHCIWSATHFNQVPHPKKLRKTINIAPIARHSLSQISLYYIMFMNCIHIVFIFRVNIWSFNSSNLGKHLEITYISFLLHTHTCMRVKQTPHFPTPIYAHTCILPLVLWIVAHHPLSLCMVSTISLYHLITFSYICCFPCF